VKPGLKTIEQRLGLIAPGRDHRPLHRSEDLGVDLDGSGEEKSSKVVHGTANGVAFGSAPGRSQTRSA
jgi:hypothetical protein